MPPLATNGDGNANDNVNGGDIAASHADSAPALDRRSSNPGPPPVEDEKKSTTSPPPPPPSGPSVNLPDATSPITYRYLAFDTVLPAPVGAHRDGVSTLPEGPSLRKHASPLTWPSPRKNVVLFLSCAATFLTAYSAGSFSPPASAMAADLGSSHLAMLAGISTFCAGFALSPMVLAPVSEIYGRKPVLVASGVLYVVFQAVCSVVPDLAGMLIARFFVGVGGAVFSSVIGGVIADLWSKDDRNTPMALFSGSVLAGTGAGPLIASVIMARIGGSGADDPNNGNGNVTLAWRWVFWHQVIADGVLLAALWLFLNESRASVILSKKARALNRWYEQLEAVGVYGVLLDEGGPGNADADADDTITSSDAEQDAKLPVGGTERRHPATPTRLRWLVREDEERASLTELMKTSLLRPFHLLVAEPVVFFFSIWCAFAWAVLYLTFGSIPLALERRRGMNIEESGRFFAAMIVGAVVATAVGICQDRLLRLPQWRQAAEPFEDDAAADLPDASPSSSSTSSFWRFMRRRFPAESPESRLYFTCLTATLLPAGLFLFGFTADASYHWTGPAFGIALATWGIFSVYLATFNYFADIYTRYASSALAAQSFCRNVLGGVFPLVTGFMFRNLGEENAGALLGGIAAGLTVIPWVLVLFGERIRARSKFAISLNSP